MDGIVSLLRTQNFIMLVLCLYFSVCAVESNRRIASRSNGAAPWHTWIMACSHEYCRSIKTPWTDVSSWLSASDTENLLPVVTHQTPFFYRLGFDLILQFTRKTMITTKDLSKHLLQTIGKSQPVIESQGQIICDISSFPTLMSSFICKCRIQTRL